MSCHYFLVYSDILIISISTKISWNYFLNKCLVYLNLVKLRSTVNKITFFDRDDNYMYLKNLRYWKKKNQKFLRRKFPRLNLLNINQESYHWFTFFFHDVFYFVLNNTSFFFYKPDSFFSPRQLSFNYDLTCI